MSADTVIRVENLSKKYIISHQRNGSGSGLRHMLEDKLTAPWRALKRARSLKSADGSSAPLSPNSELLVPVGNSHLPSPLRAEREEFWALKNVSFEVKRGEVVGIIGRNGAGKSTLLKILSRITEPATGRVEIDGRLASLLEVGTGFHPELTGRENIFLNGAILGMTRREIRGKFDEIVAFAEVDKFLDTPVKRYSSGMYVRLAFAVAAHLEPEILIVDEVLAVGDAEFQRKCIGKMRNVSQSGRTVLFVSHNTSAVQALCTKAMYLQAGSVRAIGPVQSVLEQYASVHKADMASRRSGGMFLSDRVMLENMSVSPNNISVGDALKFTICLSSASSGKLNEIAVLLYSAAGVRVAVLDLRVCGIQNVIVSSAGIILAGHINEVPLLEGDYEVGLYVVCDGESKDMLGLARFSITGRTTRFGHVPYPTAHRGVVELTFSAGVT